MLKLIDGSTITEEIRNAFKRNETRAYLEFSNGITITQDNYLKEFTLENIKYNDQTGGIIGEATSKRLSVKLTYHDRTELDLQDKEFDLVIGVVMNNTVKWIKYGSFIVRTIEKNDTEETIDFEAFDFMDKTNIPYKHQMEGNSWTYYELAENVCNQCGLELGSTEFRNSTKKITANYFINNETCRIVLKEIAKVAFSWVRIGQDNKVYFDFNKKTNNQVVETFLYDSENTALEEYVELELNDTLIPLNTIIFGLSSFEGENETRIDPVLIKKYPPKELFVAEDYFAPTDSLRRELVTAGEQLWGLTYTPINLKLRGSIYLDSNDFIAFEDRHGNKKYSYCFNHIITYNGTVMDEISCPALTETETKYKNVSDNALLGTVTQAIVDKAKRQIALFVGDLEEGGYGSLSQLIVDVNGVKTEVKDVLDLTKTYIDAYGKIWIGYDEKTKDDIVANGSPYYIEIYPTGENISYLYPRANLFPDDNLFTRKRDIVFKVEYQEKEGDKEVTKTQTIRYTLPENLLYYNEEHYDKFVFDYENNECIIYKNCGYLSDGSVKILSAPTVNHYPLPEINLKAGKCKIEIESLEGGAYIKAIMVMKTKYTDLFSTKVETSSYIKQTKNEIELNVSEKYTTKDETSKIESKIDILPNQILQQVSENYVGNNEVIAKLNLEIKDGTSKVEIEGNKVSIKSDYFELKDDGEITSTGGKIAGFTITENSLDSATVGISNGHQNAFYVNSFDGTNTIRFTLDGVMYSRDLYVNGVHILEHLYYPSDEKIKKNIEDTKTIALDTIKKLKFKQWDWKKDDTHENFGLVADDVEQIIPNAVFTLEDGTKVITPNSFVYYNTKAIQELEEENRKLKEKINLILEKLDMEV